jgi:predicted solute-binding protein
MSNMVTVETEDGSVEFDAEVFNAYKDEAFTHLAAEAEAKTLVKEVIETLAETTGLDKKLVGKYLKAAYKAKTKEQRQLGEAFAAIDAALVEQLDIVRE